MAPKYKLFTNTTLAEGEKAPCAFFASPDGCRNGDKCKFAHTLPSTKSSTFQDDQGSIVSSESSDDEEPSPRKNIPSTSKPKLSEAPISPFEKQSQLDNAKKRKTRRSKKALDNNPFANPKKKAKADESDDDDEEEDDEGEEPPVVKAPTKKMKVETPNPTPVKSASKKKSSAFDPSKLNLPIASFSLMPVTKDEQEGSDSQSASSDNEQAESPRKDISHLPTPNKNVKSAIKWLPAIQHTYHHDRYNGNFDFDRHRKQDAEKGLDNLWVKSKPYGDWCKDYPQVIAMDCEMCETQDPVSGNKDHKALCRLSVVNAETGETLIDTLVKPSWPVTNYRTWINGISKENLDNVDFTLRHAQAFMMALCSEKTVIIGHALHNDFKSLMMEHYCCVDTSYLFQGKDGNSHAAVSLKDAAKSLLSIEMPKKHDSVNDAVVSLKLADHWLKNGGNVEKVERTIRESTGKDRGESTSKSFAKKLFVHRIPKTVTKEHLIEMFVAHSDVKPVEVEDMVEGGGNFKTHVVFRSAEHAKVAFATLETAAEPDASGRMQKKVYLRGGGYIRVRENVRPPQKS